MPGQVSFDLNKIFAPFHVSDFFMVIDGNFMVHPLLFLFKELIGKRRRTEERGKERKENRRIGSSDGVSHV